MSLLAYARRVLADLLDVPVLVTSVVITYLTLNFASVPVYDLLLDSFAEYIVTGSLGRSVYTFFAGLADPVALLSFALTLLLSLYLSAFVIARVWQKRTGEIENPFRRAFERIPHVFFSQVFVGVVPAVFLLLFLLNQTVPPWNSVYFFLTMLSVFLWVPLALPVVASSVVENLRGRDIVYEGLLAGRTYWWKIFLLLFFLGPVFLYIVGYLSLVPVLGPAIYQALSTVYVLALSAEAYYGFKHGE